MKEPREDKSPGRWTFLVVYVAMVGVMYAVSTPEIAGSSLTEREERYFFVVVDQLKPANANERYQAASLRWLKSSKPDPTTVNFLLPEGAIEIYQGEGHDLHSATVLERHPEWQLVEYKYANTHSSVSRYRAYRDRVEPVSFRYGFGVAHAFSGVILVIPALIVAALVNLVWNIIARARRGAH
jgi:hypothetical protein